MARKTMQAEPYDFEFAEFQRVALEMVKAQGALFGWVSDSRRALAALAS